MKQDTYLSTFISGFSSVVEEIMKRKIKDVKVLKLSDGAVLYSTAKPPHSLSDIMVFNNTFLVLQHFEFSKETSFQHVIDSIIKFPNKTRSMLKSHHREFKVLFSDENRFVKVDLKSKNLLTSFIGKKFKLRNSRSSQNFNEFWLAKRSDNFFALMLRITENKANLEKGELRPELASFLVYLSDPSREDIVWDPFGGSGAIPLKRMSFPFKKLCISDNSEINIRVIKEKVNRKKHMFRQHIAILKHDFVEEDVINSNTTKIITDPPWGLYESITNIQELYSRMFSKFSEALVIEGILIILVSREVNINDLLLAYSKHFKLLSSFDILVSGKKATVYKITRI